MNPAGPHARLRRIVAAAQTVRDLLHSAFLTFFLFLVALMLAAWLGAGMPGALVAGAAGLAAGVWLSRRIWFSERAPEPPPPMPPEHPLARDSGRLLVWVAVLAVVTIALGLANWRCPSCRRNLGGTLAHRQCPRCGIVLRG